MSGGDDPKSADPRARRAVFLDRDGVLDRARIVDGRPFPPRSVDEVEIMPGVRQACAELRRAGYILIVVTNQPDIARGTMTLAAADEIDRVVAAQAGVDDVRMCPHDDQDRCECRKPRPGLLLDAALAWRIDLHHSVMIGDRWRDIEAGRSAGCATVFIDRGYAERRPSDPDVTVSDLTEGVNWILGRLESWPDA